MRVRIIRQPTGEVDGIDLSRLIEGNAYDVGTSIGNLLMASRWAEPLGDDAPALLLPLTDPIAERLRPPLSEQRIVVPAPEPSTAPEPPPRPR